MQTINDLWDGYRRFRAGRYGEQKELYASLANGQTPSIMLIGCADSRADPSDIFDTAPGELFTVRNVANLVPPCDSKVGVHGTSAALEYAVTALHVQHIVIMGHGQCGGVGACLAAAQDKPVGQFIAPWVSLLDSARDRVLKEAPRDPQHALELEGIRASIANLLTFPFVRSAVEAGTLELHGAWFEIGGGTLSWLASSAEEFQKVEF